MHVGYNNGTYLGCVLDDPLEEDDNGGLSDLGKEECVLSIPNCTIIFWIDFIESIILVSLSATHGVRTDID